MTITPETCIAYGRSISDRLTAGPLGGFTRATFIAEMCAYGFDVGEAIIALKELLKAGVILELREELYKASMSKKVRVND